MTILLTVCGDMDFDVLNNVKTWNKKRSFDYNLLLKSLYCNQIIK